MRARCVKTDTLARLTGVVICSLSVSDEERPAEGDIGSIQEPSFDNEDSSSNNDTKSAIDDIPNPPKPKTSRVRRQGDSSDKSRAKGSSSPKKKKPFVRPTIEDIDATNEYMCQFFSATGMIPMKLVKIEDGTIVEIPLIQPKQIRVPLPYAKDDKGIPVVGTIAEIVSYHVGVLTEDTAMSKIENFIDKYPRLWSAMIVAVSCIAYVRLSQMAGVRYEQNPPVQSGQSPENSQGRTPEASTKS